MNEFVIMLKCVREEKEQFRRVDYFFRLPLI